MNNRFCFIAPMYNASKTLPKMLYSLYGQSYDNWRLILIDDVSDPVELSSCKDWINRFDSMCHGKVHLICNTEKKWEVENVLQGMALTDDTDVIARIDSDDFLCDLDALRVIDLVYEQTGCDALWTAHRWFDDEHFTDHNISATMPDGADPYKFPWVSSHMKSWRAALSKGINDLNYRGEDGKYIKRCGDQAIYLPVLHRSKKRIYLPRVMYSYRCNLSPETFQTEDAKFQKREGEFLRSRGFIS
jgi:glycosyltransferase involved in cell wall biosynthesis